MIVGSCVDYMLGLGDVLEGLLFGGGLVGEGDLDEDVVGVFCSIVGVRNEEF